MEQMRDLPKNIEAEQIVLGAIMLDGADTAIDIISRLDPEDFYDRRHRLVYQAIISLFRQDAPCDIVAVANRLDEEGRLDKAGGRLYLTSMLDKVVTASVVDYYADIVRKKADLRRLISAGNEIAELGYDESREIDEVKGRALEVVSKAIMHGEDDSIGHVGEIAEEFMSRLQALQKGEIPGISTGFPSLDNYVFGLDGKLMVIAAYTSVGKSVMMQNMALRQAKKGVPVAFISLEMTEDPLIERFIQMQGRLTREQIRYGDRKKVLVAIKQIAALPMWIVRMRDNNLMSVLRQMKHLTMRHNVQVIHVDYLQKIRGGSPRKRWEQVGEITRELSAFARNHKIGVITGSQVKRESASEKRGPKLWDMRESSDIEQDSDVIIGLYRPSRGDSEAKSERMEVEVLKNREGPVGAKMAFRFFVKEQRIEEATFTPP